jgi:hypothetical protein
MTRLGHPGLGSRAAARPSQNLIHPGAAIHGRLIVLNTSKTHCHNDKESRHGLHD